MTTILASAYAVNPYKGSEDGMGWNFVLQIARFNRILVVTRKNNREAIEKYQRANPDSRYKNISFYYFDWPYILRAWKRKGQGALLYFYLWQMTLPLFVLAQKLKFDITHNLNFHNDWTPSFLWTLGKPLVWGPVGHHPKIPAAFVQSGKPFKDKLKNSMTWLAKKFFWNLDPFVFLTKKKSNKVLAMHSGVAKELRLDAKQWEYMPSVASEWHNDQKTVHGEGFKVLSVGRFVSLKGFDVTLRAFARFHHRLPENQKAQSQLHLIGKGPLEDYLKNLSKRLGIDKAVTFTSWIDRNELMKIYQESDVFLFPSHEGAGMVVSEALSYGLPVICFDNEGPGEFVDNSCGRKVPYGEYDYTVIQFANRLTELYYNPIQRKQLSRQARSHFEQWFAWDQRGLQLRDVYDQVLGHSQAAFSKQQFTPQTKNDAYVSA
ncbi:glycosyltransferase family 4 protein [bacterium SCSIO 12741]|nr:glycosyltransferase family 4 protein [bacterium SCSIO 12741]